MLNRIFFDESGTPDLTRKTKERDDDAVRAKVKGLDEEENREGHWTGTDRCLWSDTAL
jgi:hypothetical protein